MDQQRIIANMIDVVDHIRIRAIDAHNAAGSTPEDEEKKMKWASVTMRANSLIDHLERQKTGPTGSQVGYDIGLKVAMIVVPLEKLGENTMAKMATGLIPVAYLVF